MNPVRYFNLLHPNKLMFLAFRQDWAFIRVLHWAQQTTKYVFQLDRDYPITSWEGDG